jgi:hypothetical protein
MNTRAYLQTFGLTEETSAALAAIRSGRRQVDTARRAADDRAERAARRTIDSARRDIREAAQAARFA